MNDESSPKSNQTHFVRCLKCNKILKCSRYDTSTLLNHIKTDHPEIEIVDSEESKKATQFEGNSRNDQRPSIDEISNQNNEQDFSKQQSLKKDDRLNYCKTENGKIIYDIWFLRFYVESKF